MNKTVLLIKYLSIKNLIAIYELKTNYPELSDEELYKKLEEVNPELYQKIQELKELTK